MQNEQKPATIDEQDGACGETADNQSAPESRSSSSTDAGSILDVEFQANQLFDYIDKLNNFADRAYQNAIHKTERAHKFEEAHQNELTRLRRQLDQSTAALQERNIAYAVLEKTTKAQFAGMGKHLGEMQIQLSQRDQELRELTAELTAFIKSQQETDRGDRPHAETRSDLDSGSANQEIAALRLELAKRDETIQAKHNAWRKRESDFRAQIQELEKTLRDNAVRLEQQEAAMKQKDALIQSTALKEVEIGKLIKRLSTECDSLHKELQKTRRLAQLEKEKTEPAGEIKSWRQVVGRLQEEPT